MAIQEVLALFKVGVSGADKLKGVVDSMYKGEEGAKKFELSLASLGKVAGALGIGAFAAGVEAFASGFAAAAMPIQSTATALGLTVAQVQALEFAAASSGVAFEEMKGGIEPLIGAMKSAEVAGSDQEKAFSRLGVELKDSTGKFKSIPDILAGVGEGMRGIQDPTEKTMLAVSLMGGAGLKLIPALEGITEASREYQALGGGITPESVESAQRYTAGMLKIDAVFKRLQATLFVSVEPVLSKIAKAFTSIGAIFNKITEGTHVLEIAFLALSAAAVVLGASLVTPFIPAIVIFGLWALAISAAILALDDLWAWWEGKPSMFGQILDSMFGEEASGKVHTFVEGLGTGFRRMFFSIAEFISLTISTILGTFYATIYAVQETLNALGADFDAKATKIQMDTAFEAGKISIERMGDGRAFGDKATNSAKSSQSGKGGSVNSTDSRVQTVNVTVQGGDAQQASNEIRKRALAFFDTGALAAGIPK